MTILGIGGVLSDAAVAELAKVGFDPVFGARPLKRAIQQQLENPLAQRILAGGFASGDTVRVRTEGGHLAFDRVEGGVATARTAEAAH